jgi:hypothetical protein
MSRPNFKSIGNIISGFSVDGAETSMLRIWNMARDWTWMK